MFHEKTIKCFKVIFVGIEDYDPAYIDITFFQGYEIHRLENGGKAISMIGKQDRVSRENIRLIICDQNLPDMDGSEFLERSLSMVPHARRILLIDYHQLDMEAIQRAQLFRFITRPFAAGSLINTIKTALGNTDENQAPLLCDLEIVGRDPRLLEILDMVRRVSDSTAPVLVRGETGTGKELIARALHCSGPGRRKPFVVVNCCALPETLFEAEMFGYKKGAFTGAYRDRKGRVAQAEGGTLFIDEVGEIPLPVQAKLLRFLQSGEFQPVGSDHTETAAVRIVAATNRDLEKKIEEGSFRQELYYRLKVIEAVLPPLRERRSDIPLLVEAFVKKYWARPGTPVLTGRALNILENHDFPGNVRELENVIQSACLLVRTNEIDLDALPPGMIKKKRERENVNSAAFSPGNGMFKRLDKRELKMARTQAANRVEREFLIQLMARFETVSSAARHAGMQRTYLHKLLASHGLSHKE